MKQKLPRRIAVKIGSNVLTRPDGHLDVTRVSSLVDQIAALRSKGIEVIVISSGAVASGRGELTVTKRLDTVSARQLYSAVGQAKLINRYFELFREHGLSCGQVLTMKENFSDRQHYLNQKNCFEVMLANDVIPIVNENDTVSVTELMFTDNDELSGLIAAMMNVDRLIILSNIDGIYDGDPADPSSHVIAEIGPDDDISKYIRHTKSTAGRGGMTTKYNIARRTASDGIAVTIANGRRDGILVDLLTCKNVPSTTFLAAAESPSSVKTWIGHSEGFAKGEIHVNEGAADAILNHPGTSLLPIGVVKVVGQFEKDDIVRVVNPEGQVIALGRVGCNSAKAAESAGKRGSRRPLIHTDYIYVI
ncbi:MAG: glutamate 5-kinase [Muribaculaceae bacterium]|nr:glutamate 5-kinase [Muribaculaceae bacterium]